MGQLSHLHFFLLGKSGNFKKYTYSTILQLGTPYDYGSVMHYGGKFFSKNGKPTIVPKTNGVNILNKWKKKRMEERIKRCFFHLSVESNLRLLWFYISTLSVWVKNLASLSQPIRSKEKNNRVSVAHVFLCFLPATCTCFEFLFLFIFYCLCHL